MELRRPGLELYNAGWQGCFSESLLSMLGVQQPSVRRSWHSSVLKAQPGTIGKLWGWCGYTDSASLPLSTHVWYMCKFVTFTERLSAPMVCHIYQTITIGGQLLTKAFTSLCIWYSLSNPEYVSEHSKEHSRISLIFTRILKILIATYISTSDKYLRLVAFCASQTQAYNNARYMLCECMNIYIHLYSHIYIQYTFATSAHAYEVCVLWPIYLRKSLIKRTLLIL